ncbi:MAG TPA: STAS domain-containing protein [Chryseosolibacter sp.]|nr:STAS domain-containing protein [Chryseosolibacter sp.]
MRNPHIRSDDGNVMLEGDLTIAQAGQIANKLKEMLKKDESLRVTIQNVTSMDLTFIQLLYSFTKTCRQQNKKVLLDIKLNPDLELLLSKCGFNLTLMGPDK